MASSSLKVGMYSIHVVCLVYILNTLHTQSLALLIAVTVLYTRRRYQRTPAQGQ